MLNSILTADPWTLLGWALVALFSPFAAFSAFLFVIVVVCLLWGVIVTILTPIAASVLYVCDYTDLARHRFKKRWND